VLGAAWNEFLRASAAPNTGNNDDGDDDEEDDDDDDEDDDGDDDDEDEDDDDDDKDEDENTGAVGEDHGRKRPSLEDRGKFRSLQMENHVTKF